MSGSSTLRGRRGQHRFALFGYGVAVVVVSLLGALSTMPGVQGWYDTADKPWFTPPSAVFGPVWAALYAAMAVAAWLLHRALDTDGRARRALWLWWLQLAVNLAWTPVFFAAEQLWAGLAVIVLLDVLVAALVWRAWPVSRVAALLLTPYLVWVLFATALNAGVAALN